MYPILRREDFSDTTVLGEGHAPDITRSARPGGPTGTAAAGGGGPKCHQPTEGDGNYVCCADSILQWRYRELAAEETEHAIMLETELSRWRDGKAGLL